MYCSVAATKTRRKSESLNWHSDLYGFSTLHLYLPPGPFILQTVERMLHIQGAKPLTNNL